MQETATVREVFVYVIRAGQKYGLVYGLEGGVPEERVVAKAGVLESKGNNVFFEMLGGKLERFRDRCNAGEVLDVQEGLAAIVAEIPDDSPRGNVDVYGLI